MMDVATSGKKLYRIYLAGLPEKPIAGLEVRDTALKGLIQILKWVGCEIIVTLENSLREEDLLVCFYVARTIEGANMLEKIEAKISRVELLRTSFS